MKENEEVKSKSCFTFGAASHPQISSYFLSPLEDKFRIIVPVLLFIKSCLGLSRGGISGSSGQRFKDRQCRKYKDSLDISGITTK